MSRLVEGNGAVVTGGASLRPAAKTTALPPLRPRTGLYDPLHERDACGVGFIVNLHNREVPPHRPGRAADRREPRPIAAPSAPTR